MNSENIEFRFSSINIVSKSLKRPPQKFSGGSYNFDIKVENVVQKENNAVIVYVSSNIRYAEEKQELASFIIACWFEVVNFSEKIIANENGVFIIPPGFNSTIQPVSISTARGVIFSELRGTYLHNAIMPIIYMNELKSEPLEGMNFE